MIIDIPLNYQPTVGENITVTLSGRVNAICINPTAPSTIMVTIETNDNEKAKYIGPGQQRQVDPVIPVNGFAGSSF